MPSRRQQIILNDFRGGLNTDAASDHLAPNELTSAINVDYSERGSVRKRNGTRKLNQVSYGKPVTQIFEWTRANGDIVLLAVIDKTLCKINANGSKTDIASLSSDRIRYFALQDRLYFVDGANYRLYDGWQVKELTVPKITLSVDETGSGEAGAGTYKFAIVYQSSSGIKTVASSIEEITITEKSRIRVDDIPPPLPDTALRWVACYARINENSTYEWRLLPPPIDDPDVTHFIWTGLFGSLWVIR